MKYVCDVCGYEYDEEIGEPESDVEPEPTPMPDAIIPESDEVQDVPTPESQVNTTPESPSDGEETPVNEEPPPLDDSLEPGPPSDD